MVNQTVPSILKKVPNISRLAIIGDVYVYRKVLSNTLLAVCVQIPFITHNDFGNETK